jgi:hypothetical protein
MFKKLPTLSLFLPGIQTAMHQGADYLKTTCAAALRGKTQPGNLLRAGCLVVHFAHATEVGWSRGFLSGS